MPLGVNIEYKNGEIAIFLIGMALFATLFCAVVYIVLTADARRLENSLL